MSGLLLAAAEEREASPIALVVILGLGIALVLLIRSMNKHLRRVPPQFPTEPGQPGQPVERDEQDLPPGQRRGDDRPGDPREP